jgi:hypothetical protein
MNFRELEEGEKWPLNSARNVNKPIPVESAITTRTLNAPRQLALVMLPNRVTRHQMAKEIEVRYECSGERRFFPPRIPSNNFTIGSLRWSFEARRRFFPNYHAKLYSGAQGVEALRAT